MVGKYIFTLIIILAALQSTAQEKSNSVTGEYYLRSVMETASGFRLNADSSFDFFFSYGALDRSGTGKWEQQGDTVILNSSKKAGKNFSLTSSNTIVADHSIIRIIDENPIFRSNIYALVSAGGKDFEEKTDSKGEIRVPVQAIDSIKLFLEFCPDKMFIFQNKNAKHNLFEFRIESDIMDVLFDHLKLRLNEEGMEGPHPLLKPGVYHFRKNK